LKTTRELREDRRQAKLKHMQRQIKAGNLVVRQMTAAEQGGDVVFPRRPETLGDGTATQH
jgi:hypothetical protein